MSAAYSPQKHAASVEANTELLRHAVRELAALRGDVARLVAALPTGAGEPDRALDDLVQAAFAAKGDSVWTTAELLGRSLHSDVEGYELRRAIAATGKIRSSGSLGIYLAGRVPGVSYVTPAGLQLLSRGKDGNSRVWTIAKAKV